MARLFDRWHAPALLLLVAAVAWQAAHLNTWGLWFDEAFSWQTTRFSWPDMMDRVRQDVHPPLYYVLLKIWTAALGDSVVAMRSLSFAWWIVAVLGAFLFGREAALTWQPHPSREPLDATDAGAIAALAVAVSPLVFRYTHEVRMYTQGTALLLWSCWLLLRALREQRRPAPWWVAFAVTATALAYTHYFGLLAVAALGAFAAGLLLWQTGGCPGALWRDRPARWALLCALFLIAVYLPWLPTLRSQQEQVTGSFWTADVQSQPPTRLRTWSTLLSECLLYYNSEDPFKTELTGWVVRLTALALLLLACYTGRAGGVVLAGVLIPAALASAASYRVGRNLIQTRYLFFAAVLLVVGFALLAARIPRRWARWSAAALLLAILGVRTGFDGYLDPAHWADLRKMADFIADHRHPADRVIGRHPLTFLPLKYHGRGRFRIRQVNDPELVTHFLGSALLEPGDLIEEDDITAPGSGPAWIAEMVYRPPLRPDLSRWKWVDQPSFTGLDNGLSLIQLRLLEPRPEPGRPGGVR